MIGTEQKLARGSTDALVPRETLAYAVADVAATGYTFTGRVRHLIATTNNTEPIAVVLPPVSECAGQIFTVYLDAHSTDDVTINDNGDDPDFTTITLNAADEFAVIMSNGVRWLFLNKEEAA